jgi:hypothetical protein
MSSSLHPMRTIECLLTDTGQQLQGDGCILERSADRYSIVPPDRVVAGEYVKFRLWLPNDTQALNVTLAEVRWVKDNWLAVEAILMGPQERIKLTQLIQATRSLSPDQPALPSDHILVRA